MAKRYKKVDYSNLLIANSPMLVDPILCVLMGNSDRAIIFQHILYYVRILKGNLKNSHKNRDGEDTTWVFNSYKQWEDHFYWLDEQSIGRHFRWLVEAGWLECGNFNIRPGDRTKWYTIPNDIHKVFDRHMKMLPKDRQIFFIKKLEKNEWATDRDKYPRVSYTSVEREKKEREEQEQFDEMEGGETE